jgi:hypothetical protein
MNQTRAEKIYDFIQTETRAGKTVILQTALRNTAVKAKHLAQVKLSADKTRVLIQSGKSWLDYTYVSRVVSQ